MSKNYYRNGNNYSSGVSALGVFQIIFIVLKCFNLIDWTWTKVFIPSYIWLGLVILGVLIMMFLD